MDDQAELITGPDDAGRRLDRILRVSFPSISLSTIFGAMRRGKIRVGGHRTKPDYRLSEGDRISVPASWIPADHEKVSNTCFQPFSSAGHPETILLMSPDSADRKAPSLLDASDSRRLAVHFPNSNLDGSGVCNSADSWIADHTLHKTNDIVFINKPRGMDSHGPKSLESVYRQVWKASGESLKSLAFIPGPLHRLDRNTSGILTFPVTMEGAREFSRLLRERKIKKLYLALLSGEIKARQRWEDILYRDTDTHKTLESDGRSSGGQTAITIVEPICSSPEFTFSCIEIKTGRTHQIRAQAALHGHSLLGDSKYDNLGRTISRVKLKGYFLHAWMLALPVCSILNEPLQVFAEPDPEELEKISRLIGTDPVPKCKEYAAHRIIEPDQAFD